MNTPKGANSFCLELILLRKVNKRKKLRMPIIVQENKQEVTKIVCLVKWPEDNKCL